MERDERLAAFETMLVAVETEYTDIIMRMERLKQEGKVKSVTYGQLMGRKLMYTNMLELYKIQELK